MSITRYRRVLRPLAFDKVLTTAGTPEDLVTIPAGSRGISIHVVVQSKDARLAFDATAGPTDLLVPIGATYDAEVTIRSRVSFVGNPSGKPRCFGIVWVE